MNHNWGLVCCCFRGRSLNFTTNLYVNFISMHIPSLHILFSFIPTDHEITHQWSGNPHSWDSIYQHQRKPQRLLEFGKRIGSKYVLKGTAGRGEIQNVQTATSLTKATWRNFLQIIYNTIIPLIQSHPFRTEVVSLPRRT